MSKYGWKELPNGMVYIANQEESIKTKNITEKIDFESNGYFHVSSGGLVFFNVSSVYKVFVLPFRCLRNNGYMSMINSLFNDTKIKRLLEVMMIVSCEFY